MPQPVRIDAPIAGVVIHPRGARITRRGRVRLPVPAGDGSAGAAVQVELAGLPWELAPDSVRVGGRGPGRVLGVDVVARTHPEPADTAGADLAARRLALAAELSTVADDDDAEQARRGFLDVAARTGAAALARSWASTPDAAGGLAAAEDLLAARIGEVHARRRALAERRADLERRMAALDRTIEARRAPRVPDTRTVVVDLALDPDVDPDPDPDAGQGTDAGRGTDAGQGTGADADADGGTDAAADGGTAERVAAEGVAGVEVELEVSYLVQTAGWRAGYDARLDGERVTMTWFALIAQRSGEDWPATADLVLSTARPAAHAELPELTPQFVDLSQPPPPPPPAAAPTMAKYTVGGTQGLSRGRQKAKQAKVLRTAVADEPEIDFAGSATYRPPRRVAIPADGGRHRLTVAMIEFDAALDHLTVPRISPDAYLRATITNTSPHTLLPGKVSIFRGGDFAGSGTIGTVPPGAEVELHLGVDDRVRVERELVHRSTGRRVGGGNRRIEAGYRIEVTNHTPRPVRAVVRDQIPVSRHESVTVRDFQARPEPDERTDVGLLSWTLALGPGASGRVEFSFRLEHPRGVELTGWRD
ncbi:DUF4139 domain-containing protein [Frankia sp. AiPs1]|uniref:DUF4139 domain-containing protein n=1 Tax=Frankia sp. AiPs1 TaxID=573493 RepID=UPI002044C325|nr:DUF4139 domain-containing protein [Frankia sp. AiPs1]MCM3921219.1 DUF4139 domain-containing protein [Frankia sp. AiPs1]